MSDLVGNPEDRFSYDPAQMSRITIKPVFRVSDTNWAVQPHQKARGLKFWIYIKEGLCYMCSENKGADQQRSYCTAHLRLCFHICLNEMYVWFLLPYLPYFFHTPLNIKVVFGEKQQLKTCMFSDFDTVFCVKCFD